ncbi:flavin reductase [Moraxella caviae]|uniref:Flavin reductase n=1 Tax=Moraxella caviae TaxID=34060 RepID=A0A1T0A1L0_9GAMM|nr:flavin reductase family protein [Moraxella caviae]OOR89623.1 flavin reductase [Moraxella caviae]STZ10311.1 p-hydroxyphenylacetate 3-hydroxylase, reductase component [Moraxella caviae]VEW12647.1 p-hydroxyphenylacetate 3-hydroxylase, reductase component [Moraxella caviae]
MGNLENLRELRNAFGAFMTGVTVVTTSQDGTPLGFTANSFASVSLDPALLLVSIAKSSSNYEAFTTAAHFAINVLSEDQKHISNTFAKPSDDRFADVAWRMSEQQNPLLSDVSAWFDCVTHQVVDAGDHAILIGRVMAFESAGLAGLGYYRGAYFTPAKTEAEIVAFNKEVIVSAIITDENHILLEKNAQDTWQLPQACVVGKSAEVALEALFAKYVPNAAANFIYSVYDGPQFKKQYISFLCSTADTQALQGEFVPLAALDEYQLADSALKSMLERYRKEVALKTYGVYWGNFNQGKVYSLGGVSS